MMPDRDPDDERDHAWLLARERGEPGPTISETRAGHYAQLGTLIADLPAVPAGTVQRRDWEQGVLAVIDAEVGRPAEGSGTPATPVSDRPLPQKPTATKQNRRRAVTAAVFAMVAGVAIVVFLQRGQQEGPVGPSAGDHPGSQGGSAEVTRGVHVERGRLGFDHALEVRDSKTAVFHELRDGDTVMTGDRIRASVTTSTGAYLYLAFCAEQRLQVSPSQRGVRTRAGDLVRVPQGDGELVLDSHPGSEVLYLILSQDELSVADPDLAALLAAGGDGSKPVACGASLDGKLMKSAGSPPTNVLRGERIPRKQRPQSRTDGPDLAGDPGDVVWYAADGASSPGTVIAADADGIAVVRYRFLHVSPERVDDH
jgi:hypothetical protein